MSRWEAIVIALGFGMLILAGYHVLIQSSRSWDYNGIRLQRSFALVAGESIYPDLDSGPVLNAIYGPVGAVAYLPATAMRSPAAAVLAGQGLSLLFFFLPVALLLRGEDRILKLAGFLLFAALSIDLRPLEYVAFTVHVDAPALGLGLVAWMALLRGRWSVAALFAAFAVWTKIMLLPLLVAMPAWTLLTGGWRRAVRLSMLTGGALVLVSALMVLVFGPVDRLFLNIWTVPSLHLGKPDVGVTALLLGVYRLLVEHAIVWILWVGILALRWSRGYDLTREAAFKYGFLGFFLAPMSVLGLLKQGGDVNALAYTVYFVLIGTVLSCVHEGRDSLWVRRMLVSTPAIVLVVVLSVQIPGFLETWREPPAVARWPHQAAYEYALEHPREMYFPRITLASLLAEGRVYHQSIGLWDRALAGMTPGPEHYRAHLPENLQGIAFFGANFGSNNELMDLGFTREDREPELPGFIVYRREDDPSKAVILPRPLH